MESLSYAHGRGDYVRLYRTIPSLLNQRAAEAPDKPAHIFRYCLPEDTGNSVSGRTVLTFGQIAERSLNIASALLGMGVNPGDKVALMGINCPEWMLLEYACLRIGALLVKVPSNFSTAEAFCRILKGTSSKILIVDPENSLKLLLAAFPGIMDKKQDLSEYGLGQIDHVLLLRKQSGDDLQCLESITKFASCHASDQHVKRVQEIEASIDPDDPAITFQTSGTTGFSKSVLYTHCGYINTLNHTFFKTLAGSSDPRDMVLFNDRPFAWMGAFCFTPSTLGLTIVHLEPTFTLKGDTVSSLFDTLAEEKVSCAFMLQYLLFDAMQAEKNNKLVIPPTLKNILTGGERIPQDILRFAFKSFETVRLGYGSTECLAQAFVKTDHTKKGEINLNWYEMYSNAELKLVNNQGIVVPHGEVGTMHVRSPCSMRGYLIDGTVHDLKAGWINLCDLAIMRKDGCFEIIGRTADIISCGGVKVYPKTLENVLSKHEKVDKAVVVGVPDPRLFQEVCACVIAKSGVTLTEAELQEFFTSEIQADATSITPKYYIIMDEMPKGTTGKLDRNSLAKMAIDHFKLV